ncbi:dGPFAETKE family protein [Mycobacterium kansasii]|uniref:DGPFAETKE family protein n=1 Tax=Mycobacterium kansasii TaxID=1768 RepID=A0A1V3WHG9_MYCKA|nr:dGPFAETKE family protein [Mycobacterium kansasii]
MQYCLLMHYQEGGEIGLSEEDMAPHGRRLPSTPTTSTPRAC